MTALASGPNAIEPFTNQAALCQLPAGLLELPCNLALVALNPLKCCYECNSLFDPGGAIKVGEGHDFKKKMLLPHTFTTEAVIMVCIWLHRFIINKQKD
jgi:hypothetical protein